MKKILVLLMAMSMLLFAGCTADKTNEKKPAPSKTVEEKVPEKEETPKENVQPEKDNSEAEDNVPSNAPANVNDPSTGETVDLEEVIDEFNTTEDPERKEELRQQLEGILSQFEDSAYVVE